MTNDARMPTPRKFGYIRSVLIDGQFRSSVRDFVKPKTAQEQHGYSGKGNL